MDRALRAEYLRAIGIDLWVPRAAVGCEVSVQAAERLSLIHSDAADD
jgi:hypothetical protein